MSNNTEIKRIYYSNGTLRYETTYVNGVRHGSHKTFDENGTPEYEWTFVNGKSRGVHKSWYKNGSLKIVGQDTIYTRVQTHGITIIFFYEKRN